MSALASKSAVFKFRLYVAGTTQNSTRAAANLSAICGEHLKDRHTIEIVDVYVEPRRAVADGILMTPTLMKISPSPTRRVVGTLSQTQTVLDALGIEG